MSSLPPYFSIVDNWKEMFGGEEPPAQPLSLFRISNEETSIQEGKFLKENKDGGVLSEKVGDEEEIVDEHNTETDICLDLIDVNSVDEGLQPLDDEPLQDHASPMLGGDTGVTKRHKGFSCFKVFQETVLNANDLENKGSTARDHMANERTFLAWFRTAMGSAAIGFTLCIFLKEEDDSTLSGVLFILLGLLFLTFSTWRYYKVMYLLQRGKFEANKFGVLSLIIIGAVLVLGAVIYLVLTIPQKSK